MAGCKIVTRKLVKWHDRDEEFSNVYYFGDGDLGLSPSEEEALALIDAVIAAEKLVSANTIRFLGGAAYKIGAANTPGRTDAIAIRELPATGHQGNVTPATQAGVNPEMAFDFKFLLGGRRYLRTLIHCAWTGSYDSKSITPTAPATLSAELRAFAEKMLGDDWPGDYRRIAPNGDIPTAIMYNPFLEHRQFHRYRRRNAGALES